ncbi:hypothetical protein [Nocardia salmonicida]|uniref:hypothetical protein n=1 Tax=Nocardia salmonicida TaxID=53431 RepID=UPI0033F91D55
MIRDSADPGDPLVIEFDDPVRDLTLGRSYESTAQNPHYNQPFRPRLTPERLAAPERQEEVDAKPTTGNARSVRTTMADRRVAPTVFDDRRQKPHRGPTDGRTPHTTTVFTTAR